MNKKILSVVLILCLMLAVMPMTAYAADIALCTKCGQRQTVRVTRQYANDKWHRCDLTCTVCDNTWDYWESCDSGDYREALGRIDVPTGLFFADPGSLYSPEIAYWIAERIPEPTIHIFRDCTHLASGEKPMEFMQAIVDFAGKPVAIPVS